MVIQRQTQGIENPPKIVKTGDKVIEKDDPGWNCTNSPDRVVGVVKCTDDFRNNLGLPNKPASEDESTEVVELMVKDRPDNKPVENQRGVVSLIESYLRLDDKGLKLLKSVIIKPIKTLTACQYLE